MATSPWTYFRGAAAVMAADLGKRPDTGLTVQLCGDAHILNFGLWATPERNLSFDLRDFDETLPGPFEWDVARLVSSIPVLARESGVSDSRSGEAVAACLKAYRMHMARYTQSLHLDIWYDRVSVDQLIDGDDIIRAQALYETYRASLRADRRYLIDHFAYVDAVRQIVGVGSVGMRVLLVLLEGRDGADPLLLQMKQAGPSVYEPFCGADRHANHGQRVVAGKRLIQSATDLFVGWSSEGAHDYSVRQFRDMKVVPNGDLLAPRLVEFAGACGRVLARSHARTGDPVAIAAYIGKGRRFDDSMTGFAMAYADQTVLVHGQPADAVKSGAIVSAPGWDLADWLGPLGVAVAIIAGSTSRSTACDPEDRAG